MLLFLYPLSQVSSHTFGEPMNGGLNNKQNTLGAPIKFILQEEMEQKD